MNHKAIYDALIDLARCRELEEYFERHHIIPRCLGGGDEKSNIVKLTYREHFLAHWLLIRMNEGVARRKMQHAFGMMSNSFSGRVITSWQYQIARQAKSKALKGLKRSAEVRAKVSAGMMGHKVTLETRKKIIVSNRERIVTDESKEKMRVAKTGCQLSADHRASIGIALKGRKRPDVSERMKGNNYSEALRGHKRPDNIERMKGNTYGALQKGSKKPSVSAALTGRKHSAEFCAKVSAGKRAAIARRQVAKDFAQGAN